MNMTLWWSENSRDGGKARAFHKFVQQMANRMMVGSFVYDRGRPDRAKQYMSRIEAELRAYKRTGNHEHLINISNYSVLESLSPENPLYHHDAEARSAVAKRRLGGRIGDL